MVRSAKFIRGNSRKKSKSGMGLGKKLVLTGALFTFLASLGISYFTNKGFKEYSLWMYKNKEKEHKVSMHYGHAASIMDAQKQFQAILNKKPLDLPKFNNGDIWPDVNIIKDLKKYMSLSKVDKPQIVIYDVHGDTLAFSRPKAKYISFKEIPSFYYDCVKSFEDRTFEKHDGVRYWSIFKGLVSRVPGVSFFMNKRGGSTITNQAAENLNFKSENRDISAKVRELMLSYVLEDRFSKEEIFEFKTNLDPFGLDITGLHQALQIYFNTTPDKLDSDSIRTKAMMSALAVIPKNPERHPFRKSSWPWIKERQQKVLNHLLSQGKITKTELEAIIKETDQIKNELVSKNYSGFKKGIHTDHVSSFDAVNTYFIKLFQGYGPGIMSELSLADKYVPESRQKILPTMINKTNSSIKIYTYMDLNKIKSLEKAVKGRYNSTQGYFYGVINREGQVEAIVSSDKRRSQMRFGAERKVRAGSLLKGLVTGLGLQYKQITLDSIITDITGDPNEGELIKYTIGKEHKEHVSFNYKKLQRNADGSIKKEIFWKLGPSSVVNHLIASTNPSFLKLGLMLWDYAKENGLNKTGQEIIFEPLKYVGCEAPPDLNQNILLPIGVAGKYGFISPLQICYVSGLYTDGFLVKDPVYNPLLMFSKIEVDGQELDFKKYSLEKKRFLDPNVVKALQSILNLVATRRRTNSAANLNIYLKTGTTIEYESTGAYAHMTGGYLGKDGERHGVSGTFTLIPGTRGYGIHNMRVLAPFLKDFSSRNLYSLSIGDKFLEDPSSLELTSDEDLVSTVAGGYYIESLVNEYEETKNSVFYKKSDKSNRYYLSEDFADRLIHYAPNLDKDQKDFTNLITKMKEKGFYLSKPWFSLSEDVSGIKSKIEGYKDNSSKIVKENLDYLINTINKYYDR